jgi:hypothetical protein
MKGPERNKKLPDTKQPITSRMPFSNFHPSPQGELSEAKFSNPQIK